MPRQLLSLIQPQLFAQTVNEQSLNQYGLFKNGAVQQDATISSYLSGAGTQWTLPSFINPDMTGTAGNVPTSDSSVMAPVETITSRAQKFVRVSRTRAFDVNSLNAQIIGADPMSAVVGAVSDMMNGWRTASLANQLDALLLKSGAVVSTNANKIASESVAGQGAGTKLGTNAIDLIIDTMIGAWSDATPETCVLVMHPDVFAKLAKQNRTAGYVPPAQERPLFGDFLGYPVIKDENVGKRAGTTDGFVYTIYILRTGGVRFGQAAFEPSFEIKREALAGNGSGADFAVMREYFAFHVPGTSFSGSFAGDLPTDAEIGTASKYTAVFDPRQIGIAALQFNL